MLTLLLQTEYCLLEWETGEFQEGGDFSETAYAEPYREMVQTLKGIFSKNPTFLINRGRKLYRDLRFYLLSALPLDANSATFRKACNAEAPQQPRRLGTGVRAAIMASIQDRTGETDSEEDQEREQEQEGVGVEGEGQVGAGEGGGEGEGGEGEGEWSEGEGYEGEG
jgi:hypothetical protein